MEIYTYGDGSNNCNYNDSLVAHVYVGEALPL